MSKGSIGEFNRVDRGGDTMDGSLDMQGNQLRLYGSSTKAYHRGSDSDLVFESPAAGIVPLASIAGGGNTKHIYEEFIAAPGQTEFIFTTGTYDHVSPHVLEVEIGGLIMPHSQFTQTGNDRFELVHDCVGGEVVVGKVARAVPIEHHGGIQLLGIFQYPGNATSHGTLNGAPGYFRKIDFPVGARYAWFQGIGWSSSAFQQLMLTRVVMDLENHLFWASGSQSAGQLDAQDSFLLSPVTNLWSGSSPGGRLILGSNGKNRGWMIAEYDGSSVYTGWWYGDGNDRVGPYTWEFYR